MTATPPSTAAASAAPSRLRAWVLASRPATLGAAIAPVIVGTALAHATGSAHPGAALAALAGAVLIQVGTNLFNDYADYRRGADTPERLGPPRATQRGWLTAGEVRTGAVVAFALAALAGLYLVARAGWPLVAVGGTSILAGLAYTGGPYPLAYVGLGEVFVFVFFGLVAVGGTYFVHAGHLSGLALWAAVPVGLLVTAILVVNNLRDRHTDARAGKRTLAVRLGARFARTEYTALVSGAYAVPIGLVLAGAVPATWLVPLVSLPWALRAIAAVRAREGATLNPLLGATARLSVGYAAAFALGVLW